MENRDGTYHLSHAMAIRSRGVPCSVKCWDHSRVRPAASRPPGGSSVSSEYGYGYDVVECVGYAVNELGYAVGEPACDGGYRKTGAEPGFAFSDVCCTEYGSYVVDAVDAAPCHCDVCCWCWCCEYALALAPPGYGAFGLGYEPCGADVG